MKNKKYVFAGEEINYFGRTLKRIKRLSDNLVGGFIESEENLSQEGDCFVYNNAKVFDEARVYGNAKVHDEAVVSSNAKIYGDAVIRDHVKVYGKAQIYGNAQVIENAKVYEFADVSCYVEIQDNAEVFGRARIYDAAVIYENARVYGDAQVCDDASIYGMSIVYGNAFISGNEKISDRMIVNKKYKDLHYYSGATHRNITAIQYEDNKWLFNIGCQRLITKEEFIDRIYNYDGGLEKNPHRKRYLQILNIY